MKIIVSAGGSGGHIYPALSILEKFQKEEQCEILYIGTHNRMEKDIIPKYNIKYVGLELYGFTKNIGHDLKNIFLIRKAYKNSLEIIKEFKPDIVIGVGGYITLPVIKAAHKLKIKTYLHEQNSIPGKTNKYLSKIVDKIFVSFPNNSKYFPENKVIYSGNPCGDRAKFVPEINKKEYDLSKFKKLVVVVAGSLGSMTINKKMQEFLIMSGEEKYEVVYITGNNYYKEFVSNIELEKNIKVVPFVDNLPGLLKVADVIVSRSGATTMSEIIALKKPTIFIPSPYVANNHQYYNALELTSINAGILLEEHNLTGFALIKEINKLLDNKSYYESIVKSLDKISTPNTLDIIYNTIKEDNK